MIAAFNILRGPLHCAQMYHQFVTVSLLLTDFLCVFTTGYGGGEWRWR